MGSKELSRIWEVLHNYREDCIPEGIDHHDEEWDDICYTMARLKEMLHAILIEGEIPYDR